MAVIEASDAKASSQTQTSSLASEEYVVKAMPPILGSLDMTTTYLMIIFFITNATIAVAGGAATFTYLIIGAVTFFIPCAIVTAQLGHMFPHEGSLYNWTHRALGGYWSFFVAFCAWFPGVLVMISAGDVIVTFLQGLNPHWLTDVRSQGAVIITVITFAGFLAVQRYRMVQNVINVTVGLTGVAVVLIGTAGVAWLIQGHHPLTDFGTLSRWSINWHPHAGNLALFGSITLAYLGVEVAMNMGGEITGRHVVRRHICWGTLFVLIGYFVACFSLLVVEGPRSGSATQFALVSAVDAALGKVAGNITALGLMAFFMVSIALYNLAFARLLLVAGIDQRLPASIGRLNKHRVPSHAIMFQTVVAALITALVFFVVPYIPGLGTPVNLSVEVYNIMLAASTLVWAASTAFLFINLARFFWQDPAALRRQLIVPLPVIWLSIVLGSTACCLAIIGTLCYSWMPQVIPYPNWLYIVGGLTVFCLIAAAIGSMLASSEAAWQGVSKE